MAKIETTISILIANNAADWNILFKKAIKAKEIFRKGSHFSKILRNIF